MVPPTPSTSVASSDGGKLGNSPGSFERPSIGRAGTSLTLRRSRGRIGQVTFGHRKHVALAGAAARVTDLVHAGEHDLEAHMRLAQRVAVLTKLPRQIKALARVQQAHRQPVQL